MERAANWIMSHPEEAENPNFFAEEVGQGSGENTEVISGRKRSAREMQENLTNGAPSKIHPFFLPQVISSYCFSRDVNINCLSLFVFVI